MAAALRAPATRPIVATYRYFAVTTWMRRVASVLVVSQVFRSRSPAVESMAG